MKFNVYPCANPNAMKRFLALTLFTLSLFTLQAQSSVEVLAWVTWSDGTTTDEDIYVELDPPGSTTISFGTTQQKLAYIKDDMRKYITPREVQRIEFEFSDRDFVLISTYAAGSTLLMNCVIDNKLRVLHYYPSLSNGEDIFFETNDMTWNVLSIEGENQGNNARVVRLGFRKNMMELFKSYPEMHEKVKKREYTYDNWEQMVDYFNATYGATDL